MIKKTVTSEMRGRYYAAFADFVKKLIEKIFDIGLISERTQLKAGDFLRSNIGSLKGDRKRYNSSVAEWILDKWLARIKNKGISLSVATSEVEKEDMRSIEDLFVNFYRYSGYSQSNPLYRPFRVLLSRIGDILLDLGIINDNNSEQIVNAIGLDFRGTLYNFKKDPYFRLSATPLNNIKLYLIELFKKKILATKNGIRMQELEKNQIFIFSLIDHFIEDYNLQEKSLLDRLKSRTPSYRNELLQDIVRRCGALANLRSIAALSKLLFGNNDYIVQRFLNKTHLGLKPELYILFRIIGYSLTWDVQGFKKLGSDIDKDMLLVYKSEIEQIIKDFVFANKFRMKYVSEQVKRGHLIYNKEFLAHEYNTILAMWLLCAAHLNDLSITFEDVKLFFGFAIDPTQYLLQGNSNIGNHNLIKVYSRTKSLLSRVVVDRNSLFTLEGKTSIYRIALNQILEYSDIRRVRIIPVKYDMYQIFHNRHITAYHIISLLQRNLGFDILFLKVLNKKIFVDGSFLRHHFRFSDFMLSYEAGYLKSSLLHDILLTSNNFHGTYKQYECSRHGEQQIETILQGFDKLKRHKGRVTEATIKQVFEELGIEWVYYKWISQGQRSFSEMLNIFNLRKDYINNHSIEEFVREYYNTAYNRFYVKYTYVINNMNKFRDSLSQKNII